MGRGRAKAKQTKVARDLKYRSVDTDFASLERELRGANSHSDQGEIPEQYADIAAQYGYEAEDDDGYVDKYADDDDIDDAPPRTAAK